MIIMPNWVRNALIIKGKTEDIYEFCKNHIVWHRGTQNLHFDFNTVFPEPECEEECPDKFNRNKKKEWVTGRVIEGKEWYDWYGWRSTYWGSKWNSHFFTSNDFPNKEIEDVIKLNKTKIIIGYSTPYSPSWRIEEELFNRYPNLLMALGFSSWGEFAGIFLQGGISHMISVDDNEDLLSECERKLEYFGSNEDVLSFFKILFQDYLNSKNLNQEK